MSDVNTELLSFINSSPSVFHTILSIRTYLEDAGFIFLPEGGKWFLAPGKYYTTRNDSSLIAFVIPDITDNYHFQLCASHSDSPTFKLKDKSELIGPASYLRLNVEAYGGMIDYTWLDKPLSVAGRVIVKTYDGLESRLVNISEPAFLIPSMPIHFNRDINNGYAFNRQIDLCPLGACSDTEAGDFDSFLAKEIGITKDRLVAKDLYLVNKQAGCVWGMKKEFISAPKLDDLQAVFASLKGFLAADEAPANVINVYCCFDNEEVGSGTKQGACSTFLKDVLTRVNTSIGKTSDDYFAAVASSFMVSFDNAHALHPNHPEKYDTENRCLMNKGIVIKENAAQRYTTDAFSRAIISQICQRAGVPFQTFANRSDVQGGSTLGNLSNTQVSLNAVDIGLPQLAMHSSYETAGAKDTEYAIRLLQEYYSSNIIIAGSDTVSIK